MRMLNPRDLLRRSNRDDFAASFTSFRAEIDDPVGAFDHFKVVLDHHDGMPTIDQPLKQLE